MPSDDDCMFSAILYQLNSNGFYNYDRNTLRQTVANYLRVNKASYCDLCVSQWPKLMLIMQTLSFPQRRMNTLTVLEILSCKQNLDGESI